MLASRTARAGRQACLGTQVASSRRSAFAGSPVAPHPSSARQRHCTRRSGRPAAPAAAAEPATALPVALEPPPLDEAEEEASSSGFDWRDSWWPVAFVWDVDPKKPYAFTLLDEPIVIWVDGSGAYHAFHDACPHRLVPLSEGRIAPNGQLECAYHGWQFTGCGTCTVMPQGGDPTAPRACATAYQCAVVQNMVWVKLKPAAPGGAAPDTSAIPTIPELDDPDWFGFGDMYRDIPYDYATLIENVVDAGHVPFTHHGSVSKRQSSGNFGDMRVTEKGSWGFKGIWPTGPRKGGLAAQHTLFQGPTLMRHTIDAYDKRGFANITAVYGVPTTPGRCRAIVRQPFKFKNKLLPLVFKVMPAFMGHLGNNDVLDDDVIFLHMQEKEAVRRGLSEQPIGKVYYCPGASDAYVVAFRNWLERKAGGGPFGPMDGFWMEEAGPRVSPEKLLDHYHSHTATCSICQAALARVKLARAAAAVVGALAAVAAVVAGVLHFARVVPSAAAAAAAGAEPLSMAALAVASSAVAAVAALVWGWCQRTIPRFYTGRTPPARNTVPGEWAA